MKSVKQSIIGSVFNRFGTGGTREKIRRTGHAICITGDGDRIRDHRDDSAEGIGRIFKTYSGSGVCCLYILCFYSFSKALLKIDLGVAYATWCAGGIVATTVIAAVVFGQKLNTVGVIAVVMIVVGCVILNLYGTSGH